MANKKWTVMVYMAGDNNLQEEMVFALKSMTTVGSTDNVQVVAWSDSVGLAVPYIIPKRDQTKVKRLRDRIIPSGQNQQNQEPPSLAEFRLSLTETHHLKRQQEEFIKEKNDFSAYQTSREVDETRRELIDGLKVSIEHLEETNPNAPDLKELRNELKKLESNVDSDRPPQHSLGNKDNPFLAISDSAAEFPVAQILAEFIIGTINKYKADRYALILSGHGSGAVGDFLTSNKQFFSLSIPGLTEAFKRVHDETKTRGNPRTNHGLIFLVSIAA